mgnify:FL=1
MYKCHICGKEFFNEPSLFNHKRDKHNISEVKKETNSGRIFFYVFIIFVISLIVLAGYSFVSGEDECSKPAKEINVGGHNNLELHIHSHLKIIIDGKQETIPSNIGIAYGIMRPVHTHDETGELHIEGPCKRDFTLGDFFSIWGKVFNSQCIFEKCINNENNANSSLKVFVDGQENNDFENIILKDKQEIVVEYGSSKE